MRPTTRATATTLEKCRIAVIHLGIIAENGWISDFFSDDNVWYISRVLAHVTLTVSQADCPIQVPGENELLLSLFNDRFREISAPSLPLKFQRYLEYFGTGVHTLVPRDVVVACRHACTCPATVISVLDFPFRLGNWVVNPDESTVLVMRPDTVVINPDGTVTREDVVPMQVGSGVDP
jgi:hypothetical protein